MNKQITNNKFLNQEEINKICIEYLNFIVNESLPNILSFIDDLFGFNLFVRNEINLPHDSNDAYYNFLNQKIKTIFKLQENFMKITSYSYFLYNITLKEFADLIDFNNNVSENNKSYFMSIINAIKSEIKYRNNRITCEEYLFDNNKPKINLNGFNMQNNLNIENNNNKSKINLNDNNNLNNSSNNLIIFKTSDTSNNNNNIFISENEKNKFLNYPNDDNKNIFQQLNNSNNINKNEKIIESKLENEEEIKIKESKIDFEEEKNEEKEKYIFYENNNYYEKEMENWFQISNKNLSEN